MANINLFSVAAYLACLLAVNAAVRDMNRDEQGNPCPPCGTTLELRPVCGSNGQTYDNPSVLQCHNKCLKSGVTQEFEGECGNGDLSQQLPQEYDCPCIATRERRPVCGNNGKTYSNESVLKCDAKCKKADIKVERKGVC